MRTKLLIADDERATLEALAEAFTQRGYSVDVAASGDKALDMLTAVAYDVALLDLQMPGLTGDQILARADEIAPHTAFVVLTAYTSADTAIVALRSGAIDYLSKPSSFETIFSAIEKASQIKRRRHEQQQATNTLAKIRQALQSNGLADTALLSPVAEPAHATVILQVGAILINENSQTVTYNNIPVELTPIEYRLLHVLARNPSTVLSYAELAQASHETELDEDDARSLLRAHLYRLRNKLDRIDPDIIETVRGRGVLLQSAT